MNYLVRYPHADRGLEGDAIVAEAWEAFAAECDYLAEMAYIEAWEAFAAECGYWPIWPISRPNILMRNDP